MHMLMPKKHGFTVVELLVVIVVIGILAAITIVSYLWLNKDAQAAHTVVNASQYVKSLDIYKSKYGTFPISTSYSCLGEYPASGNMSANVCYSYNTTNYYTTSASVNTELKKVGLSPTVFTDSVERGSSSATYRYRGMRYYSNNGTYYYLYYFLPAGENCDVAGATQSSYSEYTQCYVYVN